MTKIWSHYPWVLSSSLFRLNKMIISKQCLSVQFIHFLALGTWLKFKLRNRCALQVICTGNKIPQPQNLESVCYCQKSLDHKYIPPKLVSVWKKIKLKHLSSILSRVTLPPLWFYQCCKLQCGAIHVNSLYNFSLESVITANCATHYLFVSGKKYGTVSGWWRKNLQRENKQGKSVARS